MTAPLIEMIGLSDGSVLVLCNFGEDVWMPACVLSRNLSTEHAVRHQSPHALFSFFYAETVGHEQTMYETTHSQDDLSEQSPFYSDHNV